MRHPLIISPRDAADPVFRKARFTALLKDGTVITGRIGHCTVLWLGYVDEQGELQRVAFDDVETLEI